jgi:aspartate-semialdehyde dehydrogenase
MAAGNGRNYRVAVVGATGLVGREFIKVLLQRNFPFETLKLLATSRSAGKRLMIAEREVIVEETTPRSFEGVDLAFISATGEASRYWAPIAVKAGAVVIDDSSAWRMDPDVPLVVPEVNGEDVQHHKGILAIPNCATTPLVMVLAALRGVTRVTRVIADTYQSVSGTGTAAVEELRTQTQNVLAGKAVTPHVYPHQIAFNLLPQIDVFLDNGYTKEEWKTVQETHKILHDDSIAISATCVRVPVMISHSLSVHLELERPMPPDEVREVLAAFPGIVVQDEPDVSLYPMPWTAAGRDEVFVGRIRQDSSHPNGIAMWIVSDNLRKGAATNALQIAEEMINRGVL